MFYRYIDCNINSSIPSRKHVCYVSMLNDAIAAHLFNINNFRFIDLCNRNVMLRSNCESTLKRKGWVMRKQYVYMHQH